MKNFLTRLPITLLTLLALALPAFAGPLDDYYLNAFPAHPIGSTQRKSALLQTCVTGERAVCGTPLKHALSRDGNKREAATQKVPGT